MLSCLVNGYPGDVISVQDRGLAYGQGVFETLTLNGRDAADWSWHLQRLQNGAERLKIPFDTSLEGQLKEDLAKLLDSVETLPEKTVLKIILTRGAGGRGYAVTQPLEVNRVLQLNPFPQWPADPAVNGIQVVLCDTRMAINPQLAGIKHLNRLEQVLARAEWQDSSISEGLVCDAEGYLVEGTMSNLFWRRGEVLYTPVLDNCGIDGIIRQRLLAYCQQEGILLQTGRYRPEVLLDADEVFMTNSVIGLWPVTSCDSASLSGQWPVGELSRRLQIWLAA